jgi:nucleotide-binding universal stress UspA family protein
LSVQHPEHKILEEGGSGLWIRKILCPVDFSEFSHAALPAAEDLAREFGAEVTLLHVVDARYDYPEWTELAITNNSEHLLQAAKENLANSAQEISGATVDVAVCLGIPHKEINQYASENDIDLIVLPTHGRKGVMHALLGSVAERVVRTSPCPVLTVRPG